MSQYDDNDDENIFGDLSNDDEETAPKKEQVFLNVKFSNEVTNDEMLRWLRWRDELSYIQNWQDVALNSATGSSFVVHTQ